MKFLTFTIYNINNLGEIVKASDQIVKSPPAGYKIEALYSCLTNPFPGLQLPAGSIVTVGVLECDNAESMASVSLQYMFAGAESVMRIPVIDVTPGGSMAVVEKLKN